MKALLIFGIIVNGLAVILQSINGNWGWVAMNGAFFIYMSLEYKSKYHG